MSAIEARKRTVYYSPSRGRHFFTLKAAIRCEAVEIIRRKYPSVPYDDETGDPGFHWRGLPRSDVLLRRMMAVVRKAMVQK